MMRNKDTLLRNIAVLIAWAIAISLHRTLTLSIGFNSGIIFLLPTVVSGSYLGFRAGIVTGFSSYPLHIALLTVYGDSAFIFESGYVLNILMVIANGLIGAVTGRLRDLTQQLQRQKLYFEALNSGSPIATVTLNDMNTIDACNSSFEDLFGYTESEVVGKRVDDLIIPAEDRHNAVELTRKATSGEIIHHFGQRLTNNKKAVEVEIFGVPVIIDGKQVGTIAIYHDISDIKSAQEELEIANNLLEELATTDGLTGIANRRSFDLQLDDEWRRARRSKDPISLILFDIDCFKEFNDHYGHPAGDDVLRKVGTVLIESKLLRRPGDLVARYGGEEFAIILSGGEAEYAKRVASNILQAVENLNIRHESTKVEKTRVVTISAGISTLHAKRDGSQQELIESADKALYSAKEAGRNRIEVY